MKFEMQGDQWKAASQFLTPTLAGSPNAVISRGAKAEVEIEIGILKYPSFGA